MVDFNCQLDWSRAAQILGSTSFLDACGLVDSVEHVALPTVGGHH